MQASIKSYEIKDKKMKHVKSKVKKNKSYQELFASSQKLLMIEEEDQSEESKGGEPFNRNKVLQAGVDVCDRYAGQSSNNQSKKSGNQIKQMDKAKFGKGKQFHKEGK